MSRVKLGLDHFIDVKEYLRDLKVGLIVNHTSVTSDFTHLIEVAKEYAEKIVVFSPEHGLSGALPPGATYSNYFDEDYGVEVYSLYGENRELPLDLVFSLDCLIYDIQDVGVRCYTYISTLYYCVKASGKADTPLYVLDRPNPLTGVKVEGPVLSEEYVSFVGIAEIPLRYGLTPGELAKLFNRKYSLGAEIHVYLLENWRRDQWFSETGLPWVPPSPNIPSPDTALVYCGTVLIEGTNLSEGRGTTKPFEYIGAPWIKPVDLARKLNSLKLPGVLFRPLRFIPFTSKYSGKYCGGVHIYVYDKEKFKPIETALHLIKVVKESYKEFEWKKSEDKYFFDLLIGNSFVRKMIEEEKDIEEIVSKWESSLKVFKEEASSILIY